MTTPSASQPDSDALLRGQDYSDTETNNALAHRLEQQAIARGKRTMLMLLRGNQAAYKSLLKKTMARTDSAPSYEDGYP